MLVNCVMLHLSLTQTFNKFFKIKRIKKSMKMSKQWIWNLKKINMDESICCTHTQHHQLYNSGITFLTITHAWNMSTICTLYVAKVEEQANNLHCYCQIMVQIATPTANHKKFDALCTTLERVWFGPTSYHCKCIWVVSYEPYRTSLVVLEQQPDICSAKK